MADAPEPTREVKLSCKACPATWDAPVLSGVTLRQWVTHLEEQRCPDCAAPYKMTSHHG